MVRAARRAEVLARLPIVFGLGAIEAAASLGISETFFRQLVDERRMPQPRTLNGRRIWDVDELRTAFKALPHAEDAPEIDTWADVG